MFDQILFPVDRSAPVENVFFHTIMMAKAYNSQVTLINVMDPNKENSLIHHPIDPWDWRIQRAEAEVHLNDLSSDLQSQGVEVQTVLLEGNASDHLIHHSNKMGTNLIMLSSHGLGGNGGWNTSSVGAKIIQQARTSVMLIPSDPPLEQSLGNIRYRRILAPVDGSIRAEYALFAAAHLARAQDAELLITHVVKPPELPRRTPLSAGDRTLVQQVIESNWAEASQYMNALKASLDCRVETCLLIHENVPEALHNLVEQEKIDLVILTAHGLSGNPRWSYGNVAVNFITYSKTPLMIVQDFVQDMLPETRANIFSNEVLSQAAVNLVGSRKSYGVVYR